MSNARKREHAGLATDVLPEENPQLLPATNSTTEPLIANATINRGVIRFDQNVEPIPASVSRKLTNLSMDLGSGFDVRLPRLFGWVDAASGQPRAIIVREGGAP